MKQLFSSLLMIFLAEFAIAQAGNPAATVSVSGEVTTPLKLSLQDLAVMKRDTVQLASKDGTKQTMVGVSVREILKKAGVTIGPDLRGENLTKFLLVKCADGYQVVFSLAELDQSFTDRIVILADHADGKLISTDRGPFRLAVPGEKKPARSCHQVREMVVRYAR